MSYYCTHMVVFHRPSNLFYGSSCFSETDLGNTFQYELQQLQVSKWFLFFGLQVNITYCLPKHHEQYFLLFTLEYFFQNFLKEKKVWELFFVCRAGLGIVFWQRNNFNPQARYGLFGKATYCPEMLHYLCHRLVVQGPM